MEKHIFPDVERLPVLAEIDGRLYGELHRESRNYKWRREHSRVDLGDGDHYSVSIPEFAYLIKPLRRKFEERGGDHTNHLQNLTSRLFKPDKVFIVSITDVYDVVQSNKPTTMEEVERDLSNTLEKRLQVIDANEFGRYIPQDRLVYALGRIPFKEDTPNEQLPEELIKWKPPTFPEGNLVICTQHLYEGFVNPYEIYHEESYNMHGFNNMYDFKIVSEISY